MQQTRVGLAALAVLGVLFFCVKACAVGEPPGETADGRDREPGRGSGRKAGRSVAPLRADTSSAGRAEHAPGASVSGNDRRGPDLQESSAQAFATGGDQERQKLLAYLRERRGPGTDFDRLVTAESMQRYFSTASSRVQIEPSVSWPSAVGASTEIRLGRGVTTAAGDTVSEAIGAAEDVTISGEGRDETVLFVRGPIRFADAVGVVFRDLTVVCDGDALMEIGGVGVVHIDRSRVVGFDGGTRASQLIRGTSVALLATESVFASGFGPDPGVSSLFNVSPGRANSMYRSIARFERCVFEGPFIGGTVFDRAFFDAPPGVSLLLVDCEIRDADIRDKPALSGESSHTRVEGCEVTFIESAPEATRRRRSVSEVNPLWSQQAVEGSR